MEYDTFMRILKSDLIKVEKLLRRDDFLARDELSEIIEEEVKQLIEVMQAPQPYDDYFSAKSKAEKLTVLVNRAQELASESEGFLRSLKLAVKRSDPEKLAPWRDGVKYLIAEAHRWPDLQETPPGSEVTKEVVSLSWKSELVMRLRHIPGTLAVLTIVLSAIKTQNWEAMKVLLADNRLDTSLESSKSASLVLATHLYKAVPYGDDQYGTVNVRQLTSLMLYAERSKRSVEELAKQPEESWGAFHNPQALWYQCRLQPLFVGPSYSVEQYEHDFTMAETLLALFTADELQQDNPTISKSDVDLHSALTSYWLGCSSDNRFVISYPAPYEEIQKGIDKQGTEYPLLEAGLFGGSETRLRSAMRVYKNIFSIQ